MREDPAQLVTEATKVLSDSKEALKRGYQTVHDIPARIEEARRLIKAAREEKDRAQADLHHAYVDEGVSRARERRLQAEYERAYWRTSRAEDRLTSDDVDAAPEGRRPPDSRADARRGHAKVEGHS